MTFLCVHSGACAASISENTLKLHKKACLDVIKNVSLDTDPLSIVSSSIAILENNVVTNAGLGSCLNRNGHVECDASLVCSDGYMAAVCALKDVKNPILVAKEMIVDQKNTKSTLVAPIMLAGEGALEYARSKGYELFDLKSEQSLKDHDRISKTLNFLDTVGALSVDALNGVAAAGCSSGGIMYKHPGRIGSVKYALYTSHSLGSRSGRRMLVYKHPARK